MKTVIHLQWNRQYTFVVWIILSRKLIILFKINRNVRLWNMIYNLFAVHVKLLKLKGNTSWGNTEKNICMTAWNLLPIGVFSIVFCIASYSICFSLVAWQSSGPNNNHWRFYLNLGIPWTFGETCVIHLYKAIQIDE